MDEIGRPKQRVRIPVVLSRAEVATCLLAAMNGIGSSVSCFTVPACRLLECLSLRVKDLDFDRKDNRRASWQGRQGSRRHAARELAERCENKSRILGAFGLLIVPTKLAWCLHAGCARTKVPACGRKLGVALAIPVSDAFHRSSQQNATPAPSIRTIRGTRHRASRMPGAESPRRSLRIRCGIPSQRICSTQASTSVECRNCSATAT